jgi:hypothetical protein
LFRGVTQTIKLRIAIGKRGQVAALQTWTPNVNFITGVSQTFGDDARVVAHASWLRREFAGDDVTNHDV